MNEYNEAEYFDIIEDVYLDDFYHNYSIIDIEEEDEE